jgi:hypothetical protein
MLLPMKTKDGEEFYIEVTGQSGHEQTSGEFMRGTAMGGGSTPEGLGPIQRAGKVVRSIAEELSVHLKNLGESTRPSEIAMEVEVGFDMEGRVMLVFSSKTSASLKLSLKWTL